MNATDTYKCETCGQTVLVIGQPSHMEAEHSDPQPFVVEMQAELEDYNTENGRDADEDLLGIDRDLRAAIAAGDAVTAWALAREGRRYLIANGYADDDELPAEM